MKKLSKKWKIIIGLVSIIIVVIIYFDYTVNKSVKDYYFNPDGTVRTDSINQRGMITK